MVKRSEGTLNLNFLGYEIYYDSSFIIIENNGEVREMNVTSSSRNVLIPLIGDSPSKVDVGRLFRANPIYR